jgi:hypothetical protein
MQSLTLYLTFVLELNFYEDLMNYINDYETIYLFMWRKIHCCHCFIKVTFFLKF